MLPLPVQPTCVAIASEHPVIAVVLEADRVEQYLVVYVNVDSVQLPDSVCAGEEVITRSDVLEL